MAASTTLALYRISSCEYGMAINSFFILFLLCCDNIVEFIPLPLRFVAASIFCFTLDDDMTGV